MSRGFQVGEISEALGVVDGVPKYIDGKPGNRAIKGKARFALFHGPADIQRSKQRSSKVILCTLSFIS